MREQLGDGCLKHGLHLFKITEFDVFALCNQCIRARFIEIVDRAGRLLLEQGFEIGHDLLS